MMTGNSTNYNEGNNNDDNKSLQIIFLDSHKLVNVITHGDVSKTVWPNKLSQLGGSKNIFTTML